MFWMKEDHTESSGRNIVKDRLDKKIPKTGMCKDEVSELQKYPVLVFI